MIFTFFTIFTLKIQQVVFFASLEMGDLIPPKPWLETNAPVGYALIALTIIVVAIILKKLKE
ncbi:MAG: hypothetical protein ACYC9R_08705 [Nitrosotalea sp.]